MLVRRVLAVAVPLSVLAGCLDGFAMNIGESVTNPRLRPDLAPLPASQMPPTSDPNDPEYFASIDGTQASFEDGGPNRDQLVTPTMPSMSKVSGYGDSARGILRSRCYWVGAHDPIELRWEVVFPLISTELHPDDVRMSGCHRHIALQTETYEVSGFEPLTRRGPIHPDSGEFFGFVGDIGTLFYVPVLVDRARATVDYPVPDGPDCYAVGSTPFDRHDEVPILGCSFATDPTCNPWGCPVDAVAQTSGADGSTAHDVGFQLATILPSQASISEEGELQTDPPRQTPWVPLEGPTYRVVAGSRVFRAPLALDTAATLQRDEFVYRWRMPTYAVDGVAVPQSSFHPSLDSNVRFLVLRDGQSHPLTPKRIVGRSPSPDVDCLPDQRPGHSHDQLRTCRNGTRYGGVNPNAYRRLLHAGDNPLTWEVTFDLQDDPLTAGPGPYGEEVVVADGQVFMEFTLFEPASTLSSADAYRVTPSRMELGATKRSGVKTSVGWFENLTLNTVTVRAARFNVGQHYALTSPSLPRQVGPGESFQFEVAVNTGGQASGQLQDMLHFDVETGTAPPVTLTRSVKLDAEAVLGAHSQVAPESMFFWVQPGEPADHQRAQGHVLITNVGSNPFDREPLVLEGPDAAAFKISAYSASPGDDPGLTATLSPGASNTFRVDFVPRHAGEHKAFLRFKHSAENGPTQIVPLSAYYP